MGGSVDFRIVNEKRRTSFRHLLAVHPETGDISLACEGFNHKNTFDHQTPCDLDYIRKMARRTEPELLEDWFNRDVVGIYNTMPLMPKGSSLGMPLSTCAR